MKRSRTSSKTERHRQISDPEPHSEISYKRTRSRQRSSSGIKDGIPWSTPPRAVRHPTPNELERQVLSPAYIFILVFGIWLCGVFYVVTRSEDEYARLLSEWPALEFFFAISALLYISALLISICFHCRRQVLTILHFGFTLGLFCVGIGLAVFTFRATVSLSFLFPPLGLVIILGMLIFCAHRLLSLGPLLVYQIFIGVIDVIAAALGTRGSTKGGDKELKAS